MNKDYVFSVAKEIQRQIIGLTPSNVLFSWGVSKWTATVFNGMPALKMDVNGFNTPNGCCIVALDEGADYYRVFIQNQEGKVSMVAEDVDFTQLPDVLDRYIEVGDDHKAYDAFCGQEKERLLKSLS